MYQVMTAAMGRLTRQQAAVLQLIYIEGSTRKDAGKKMGIAGSRVGQLEKAALKHLRVDKEILDAA